MEQQGELLLRRKAQRQQESAQASELHRREKSRERSSEYGAESPTLRGAGITSLKLKSISGKFGGDSLPPLQITPRGFAATTMASLSASHTATIPPYRRHLEERQREIEEYIEERVREATEHQRFEEAQRIEACRRQRDVERITLRQRVKHRIQLQAAARQPIPEGLLQTMGIDVSAVDVQHHSTHSQEYRKALCELPTKSYLAHNANRLAASSLHREACLTAERRKALTRIALEEYVGSEFARMRKKKWDLVQGQTNETVRCPTPAEEHRARVARQELRRKAREEEMEIKNALDAMTTLDDAIWTAESARRESGRRRALTKDLRFDLELTLPSQRPSTVERAEQQPHNRTPLPSQRPSTLSERNSSLTTVPR